MGGSKPERWSTAVEHLWRHRMHRVQCCSATELGRQALAHHSCPPRQRPLRGRRQVGRRSGRDARRAGGRRVGHNLPAARRSGRGRRVGHLRSSGRRRLRSAARVDVAVLFESSAAGEVLLDRRPRAGRAAGRRDLSAGPPRPPGQGPGLPHRARGGRTLALAGRRLLADLRRCGRLWRSPHRIVRARCGNGRTQGGGRGEIDPALARGQACAGGDEATALRSGAGSATHGFGEDCTRELEGAASAGLF
mmetsp:Transcript_11438/g.40662  ORF Transcript_11438/g.40662 Transcript_11438/m.40662 type:complete len:249 (-) Transcript_11438:1309-2055(-)